MEAAASRKQKLDEERWGRGVLFFFISQLVLPFKTIYIYSFLNIKNKCKIKDNSSLFLVPEIKMHLIHTKVIQYLWNNHFLG